jgi:hypothetical protein
MTRTHFIPDFLNPECKARGFKHWLKDCNATSDRKKEQFRKASKESNLARGTDQTMTYKAVTRSETNSNKGGVKRVTTDQANIVDGSGHMAGVLMKKLSVSAW